MTVRWPARLRCSSLSSPNRSTSAAGVPPVWVPPSMKLFRRLRYSAIGEDGWKGRQSRRPSVLYVRGPPCQLVSPHSVLPVRLSAEKVSGRPGVMSLSWSLVGDAGPALVLPVVVYHDGQTFRGPNIVKVPTA